MILVLNVGSSSVKDRLFDGAAAIARGLMVRVGEPGSKVVDHAAAVRLIADEVRGVGPDMTAVGHRACHGGGRFTEPALIDDEVLASIRDLIPLALLYNAPCVAGIEAARVIWPDVPHVAVFDTAFHATIPVSAATYAIDSELAAAHGIRRYGFHGTSHRYVARRTAAILGRPLADLNLIVLHHGNGASACAVPGGRWPQRRDVDGPHAVGGSGHGYPVRRHRPRSGLPPIEVDRDGTRRPRGRAATP